MAGATLPERVAQIYYTYGLFCSSYPVTAISLAISVVLLCCYPLLNVPLPGNIPTVINLPLHSNAKEAHHVDCSSSNCPKDDYTFNLELFHNETQKLPYIWAKDKPLLFVQQIVMKIGVSPWSSNLKMWDAFRAPLQEVFRLLETVRNHEDPETKNTLPQLCYQVEGIKRRELKAGLEQVMPEYSCLLLSPANLWQQNMQSFSLDSNIVNTVYSYQKGKSSIAEMAFGVQLRDSGVKRYPLRARPRVLQYAITIFYEHADQMFINSLTKKLKEMYPLYQDNTYNYVDEVTIIYYPGQFNYRELVPLMITFVGLFLYVYFSVRKIEFIKSKLGLSACSVVTIAGSLSMSMGICFYFGFSLSLQGKEIFPYLLIIVGLENVLVLTKSVTSTDSRLDVKIRLAQGLSKEGWSITKNLLTEITILTVSFFTFVPFIQEFSIFMIVSLISDYFVQMVFFATILGIDVRRMECFQDQNKLHLKEYFSASSALNWRYNQSYSEEATSSQRMTKSKSHPRLNGLANSPTDVVASRKPTASTQDRVPKRIRLVNMWARTRFFQRAFMVWMLVWISMIVYNSGVVDHFITTVDKADGQTNNKRNVEKQETKKAMRSLYSEGGSMVFSPLMEVDTAKTLVDVNDTLPLKHSPLSRPWTRLSPYHWSSILGQYNLSVGGRYIALLPPALVSHRVPPERAAMLRAAEEPPPLHWQVLAALDPVDLLPEILTYDGDWLTENPLLIDFELMESKSPRDQWGGQGSDLPIYPTTPMELLLLAILCTISVAVIAYMMVVLYRCVCSRNYAEWRASWNENEDYKKMLSKQPAVQLVMEAVPLVVAGHSQEVECLVTDGEKIISSCLQGNVKVWDSQNGEIITNIDRSAFFKLQKEIYEKVNQKKNNNTYAVEEVSADINMTPKTIENVHSLRKNLNNHLSGLRFRSTHRESPSNLSAAEATKYEFVKSYRELYCTDQGENMKRLECTENIDFSNSVNKLTRIKNASNTNSEIEKHKVSYNSDDNSVRMNNSYSAVSSDIVDDSEISESSELKVTATNESPIWCMDFCKDLIILGCADGRLEFWEASTGKLVCVWWWSESNTIGGAAAGVTHVRAICDLRRVCVATLTGHIILLKLNVYDAASGTRVDWRFSTAHRRTHKRTGSTGSMRSVADDAPTRQRSSFCYDPTLNNKNEVVCVRTAQCRPHQQPITELHSDGGRILTGAQDHVLKVFSSLELSPLFTLHGHCGPITSCFIDHLNPTIAGSGSQDGLLCVWDLHTGACLYSVQAHDGSVTALTYTTSYVVSAGADERLCIFDRFQGHMLNSLHIGLNYLSRMLPLTHTLLLMGDRSGLTVYDLSEGDVLRKVLLGQSDGCIFVRQILPLKDAVVCDYANQLRIVRFPLVSRLSDMKSE